MSNIVVDECVLIDSVHFENSCFRLNPRDLDFSSTLCLLKLLLDKNAIVITDSIIEFFYSNILEKVDNRKLTDLQDTIVEFVQELLNSKNVVKEAELITPVYMTEHPNKKDPRHIHSEDAPFVKLAHSKN